MRQPDLRFIPTARDLRFVPLNRDLLDAAVLEERDELTAEMTSGDHCAARLLAMPSLAGAMLGRGRVLAAAGLVVQWPGRAEAWMLVSRHARPRDLVVAIDRCAEVLNARQRDPCFRRIEMFCRADEPWTLSFAARLGMVCEGRLRKWDALGRDYLLFARIKELG